MAIDRKALSAAIQKAAAEAQGASLAAATGAAVAAGLKFLADRVDELEKRLEEQPQVRYMGVHEPGTFYKRGDFVTHSGSLWACTEDGTRARPGTGDFGWVLAVKKGRDARDLRQ